MKKGLVSIAVLGLLSTKKKNHRVLPVAGLAFPKTPMQRFRHFQNDSSRRPMTSTNQQTPTEYAPSQFTLYQGEKWRLCVGAAVLNSKHQSRYLLIPNVENRPLWNETSFKTKTALFVTPCLVTILPQAIRRKS